MDLEQAVKRLREEVESGCASPEDITFWQSEVIRLAQEVKPTPKHKSSGGYGPHDWDCPACKAESERRSEYRKNNNPHRPGTKAAAKWDRDRASVDWAMDMRGETYWCM